MAKKTSTDEGVSIGHHVDEWRVDASALERDLIRARERLALIPLTTDRSPEVEKAIDQQTNR